MYAFYCARYDNISYEDFLHLGFLEFNKKLGSIPETEPLHKIIKSRNIKIGSIKNKEEKRYWRELKKANKIPQLYLSDDEINDILKESVNNGKRIS